MPCLWSRKRRFRRGRRLKGIIFLIINKKTDQEKKERDQGSVISDKKILSVRKSLNVSLEQIDELNNIHHKIKPEVDKQISSFKNIWSNGSDVDLFTELAFCLLTPQAKALEAWAAICKLVDSGDLFTADAVTLSKTLNRVRFKNNKAVNLIAGREMFTDENGFRTREILNRSGNTIERRKWLAENVRGMGYKEASHYLRNIGFVEDVAILDRHILKNMVVYGIIPEVPKSINPKTYLELEKNMKHFASGTNIPLAYLDYIFWFKDTKIIFK